MFIIRKIKWVYGKDMSNTDYIINNIFFFCRGLWPGLMFSISGLGLYKYEREIFNVKRFETRDAINIYFLKWVLTYDKKGYLDHF